MTRRLPRPVRLHLAPRAFSVLPTPEELRGLKGRQARAVANAEHKRAMQQVVNLARETGWSDHWVWDSRHSPKGKLDLTLKRVPDAEHPRRRPRWIEAELKTGKGKPTKEQREEFERLAHFPHVERYLWHPLDPDEWRVIERVLAEDEAVA